MRKHEKEKQDNRPYCPIVDRQGADQFQNCVVRSMGRVEPDPKIICSVVSSIDPNIFTKEPDPRTFIDGNLRFTRGIDNNWQQRSG